MQVAMAGPVIERAEPSLADWFAQRSFARGHFGDLARLAAAKRRRRATVSLILPTLNVAQTLPDVLAQVGQLLSADLRLVDEVIVVDGASTDRTRAIARDAGVDVYLEDSLMPRFGRTLGKGDAMWRALDKANGDIIAFADTDTRNFSRDLVAATIGPLLADEGTHFVKAAFRRPFVGGQDVTVDGGGRVTELTAKPLFNVFFPQLAGFAQPLAGEFAGTRQLLRSVPFFTGYGVETGLLIDALRTVGLAGMAQVDVGTRLNRHQQLGDLGRMSYSVLRAILQRAGGGYSADATRYLHAAMGTDGFRLTEHGDELVERPPMADLMS